MDSLAVELQKHVPGKIDAPRRSSFLLEDSLDGITVAGLANRPRGFWWHFVGMVFDMVER